MAAECRTGQSGDYATVGCRVSWLGDPVRMRRRKRVK